MPLFPRRQKRNLNKKNSPHPLTPTEAQRGAARQARIARWKRYGKYVAAVALGGGAIWTGREWLRARRSGQVPVKPTPIEGPQVPGNGRRQPVEVDPIPPKQNGRRQPVNPNTTEPGSKPKTRVQQLEEQFKAMENIRLRDRQFPFVPREMSFEAAKKVIESVLEKDFRSQNYNFRNPSWQRGQGELNNALEKAPIGSILQLSRLNPETGKKESTFMVKVEDDFYYYTFLDSQGVARGESGSILQPVLKSTGSEVIGIYAPHP